MEEVSAYFSHDKLQCLLCGKEYAGLGNHVVEGHGISVDDYKEKFGLPWSSGLSGKTLKTNQSKRLKKSRRDGKIPYAPEPEHIRKLHAYKKQKNRDVPVAVRNDAGKRVLERFGLERKWGPEDFEEYLRRIKTGRTPSEVGKDKDMPADYLFHKFARQNPEFHGKFEKIWDKLPFEVQSRGLHFGDRIKNRVIELRMKGNSFPDVGRLLGIPEPTARNIWFKVKHASTGKKRKMLEDYEKSLRIDPRLFDKFLQRIKTGRTPSEVGKDKDMPSRLAFDKHVRENPQFRKKYNDIWNNLHLSVQVRGHRTGKVFRKAVIDLRTSGLSWDQIATELDVPQNAVRGLWHRLKETGTAAEKTTISRHSRKQKEQQSWSTKEMDTFLRRIAAGRTSSEVAKDPDMPRREYFNKYIKKHPDYEKRYREIWEKLPFTVQVRGNRLGERFKREVVRLRMKGHTDAEIGKMFGIKTGTVRSTWHRLQKNGKLKNYL